jgi:hypothetical protein
MGSAKRPNPDQGREIAIMSPGSQALPLASNALRRLARRAAPLGLAMLALAPATAAASADPPPGRGYELVSPPDAVSGALAGVTTDLYPTPGRLSEDGEALIYGTGSSLGENWSGPANPMVFGWRTENGWRARTAIRSGDYGNTPLELIAHEARSGWLTPDGNDFVTGVAKQLTSESQTGPLIAGVFRMTSSPTVPAWLSAPGDGLPLAAGVGALNVVAGGDDYRTVAFQSSAPLTADAPPQGTNAVYVSRDGTLELASRLPDGSVATDNVFLANGDGGRTGAHPQARGLRNVLAGGGRFLLFHEEHDLANRGLHVRDLEQGVTRQLAGDGGAAPDLVTNLKAGWGTARGATADIQTIPDGRVFAARDGARAFFKTDQTAVAPFLYEANLETGAVTARPALSGPPLALSPDGRRMLFVEPSDNSLEGNWTLRFWDASDPGASVELGTVPVPLSPSYGFAQGYEPTPDGRTWVFAAMGSLDPARPNASPGIRQLYVWNVGDGAPTCLSCRPTDGVARTTGPNVSVQESVSSEGMMTPTSPMSPVAGASKMSLAQPGHAVSEDGRWVLFDSPDRLVGEDRNNVRDVYLWDRDGAPGGQLQLATRGTGSTPSYALDIDPSGRNAAFATRDELVAADTDGAYDIYVARIGGGFSDSPEPSCGGDGCRPAAGPPAGPVIGSVAFAGRGNASPPAGSASVRVSGLKAVVGRVARLRVRVPGAGRVSVAGASIRQAGKSAGKAGTYTVRVALKQGARKKLAKRERLRVAVRVSYRSASGQRVARTVRITFKAPKQPAKAGRKGGR